MRIQVIEDENGKKAGVFIPAEDWMIIKSNYPDIESLDDEIPEWHKKTLDNRINLIKSQPELLRPIQELFENLD